MRPMFLLFAMSIFSGCAEPAPQDSPPSQPAPTAVPTPQANWEPTHFTVIAALFNIDASGNVTSWETSDGTVLPPLLGVSLGDGANRCFIDLILEEGVPMVDVATPDGPRPGVKTAVGATVLNDSCSDSIGLTTYTEVARDHSWGVAFQPMNAETAALAALSYDDWTTQEPYAVGGGWYVRPSRREHKSSRRLSCPALVAFVDDAGREPPYSQMRPGWMVRWRAAPTTCADSTPWSAT